MCARMQQVHFSGHVTNHHHLWKACTLCIDEWAEKMTSQQKLTSKNLLQEGKLITPADLGIFPNQNK